jgi:hypothetical protein
MTTLTHAYDERRTAAVTHTSPVPAPSPEASKASPAPEASDASFPAEFPAGRYGRRRDPVRQRRRRWVSYALAGLVVIAGAGIALKLYQQYTLAPYQVQVLNVTNLTDTQVTVLFEVSKPAGQPALCTVQGHTREGEEVGKAEVPVPAGSPDETTTQVTYTLVTTKRPVTAEVPGCGPA